MQNKLTHLTRIIPELAQQEIMPRFNQVGFTFKGDGSLVTDADTAMQRAVIKELNKRWPECPCLGEEMTGDHQQGLLDSENQGLWILDPLDGTTNFSSGIPFFSVSLALVQNGEVRLGLIYDPVRDECFSAVKDQGAWLNGKRLKLNGSSRRELDQCVTQVDFKRLPAELAMRLAAEHPFASQRNFGSGALDWCWLATARSQLYVHGGQKLWDYAAGQLILLEAGGCANSFSGEPVFSLSLKPQSIVAASHQHQLQQLMDQYFS
ncbi:MAG: inositol monophosphatase [Gammaproteobacteria bacterium]|nr:inositol monophosphatase [Gammaproteobacteria bacterium]